MYKGLIKKSRTFDAATLMIIFGVVQQNLPMVQESLGDYYGFIFMGVGIVFALLRQSTKGPVGEK